jgi:molybdopterin converting factor small subunit
MRVSNYLIIMQTHIQIKLFASLKKFMPANAENYAIETGTPVHKLLQQLGIPEDKFKLVFIDGVRADLTSTLKGGERVGIFPPVGGG